MDKEVMQTGNQLVKIEAIRRKAWQIFKGAIAIEVIVAGLLYFFSPEIQNNPTSLFWGGGISLMVDLMILGYFYGKVKKSYKSDFVTPLINHYYPHWSYDPKGYISADYFKTSGLFSYYNRYHGDDLFVGMLGEKACRFSELQVSHSTSNGKSSSSQTIFSGLFIILDDLKTDVDFVVMPDYMERMFGKLAKKLERKQTRKGELVSVQHPEFEKLFQVRSTTPELVKKRMMDGLASEILSVRGNLLNGKWPRKRGIKKEIRCAVHNHKLYIAFDGICLFQVPFFKSVEENASQFTQNIHAIKFITETATRYCKHIENRS